MTSNQPRYAKAHSQQVADEYVRLGWEVVKEFFAPGDDEPYEYLLRWNEPGDPQRPSYPDGSSQPRAKP